MKLLEDFQLELDAATLRAAKHAVSEYGAEGIYSFALYTSGEYGYVFATLSTTAGLERVAAKYLSDARYKKMWGDIATAMKELKWSPCDSPHHTDLNADFTRSNKLLEKLWEKVDQESDDAYFDMCEKVHQTFMHALTLVHRSKVFNQAVTLNILMGDQSDEERLKNAKALNSAIRLKAFRSDLQL